MKGPVMQIDDRVVNGVTVLDLRGKMTVKTAEGCLGALKERVDSLVKQGQVKLVINLEAVSYLDSMCLGEIISAYTTVRRHGSTLKLLKVPARIRELLEIAKLMKLFEIFDAEREAVDSFSREPTG